MNTIFEKQIGLLEAIANNPKVVQTPIVDGAGVSNGAMVNYLNSMKSALEEELRELTLEIGNNDRAIMKPWSTKYLDIAGKRFLSTPEIRSEAIDLLCFAMNMCIAVGIDESNIDKEYEKVWRKNMLRQRNGY